MNKKLIACLLVTFFSACAITQDGEHRPLDIVNKRMESYNNHDLQAFMATYADDVQVYTYPDRLLTSGKDGIRSIFGPMFEEAAVKVTIHHQFEKDSYVINHETVQYPDEAIDYISVYRVEDGLITDVRFIRD